MQIHKLIIAGPRYLKAGRHIVEALEYFDLQPVSIITGGAPGVDEAAIEYAEDNDIVYGTVNADWSQYGRAAGPIRNRVIAQQGSAALCVWDGESRDTANMIEAAIKEGKPVFVWPAEQKNDEPGGEVHMDKPKGSDGGGPC